MFTEDKTKVAGTIFCFLRQTEQMHDIVNLEYWDGEKQVIRITMPQGNVRRIDVTGDCALTMMQKVLREVF